MRTPAKRRSGGIEARLAWTIAAVTAIVGLIALAFEVRARRRAEDHARQLGVLRVATPEETARRLPDELSRIDERLAALERELVALRRAVDAGAGRAAVPAHGFAPVLADGTDLAARLDELQALVERLSAPRPASGATVDGVRDPAGERAPPPTLAMLHEERPDADWGALQELSTQWHADEERARSGIRFATYAEALRRFGSPTEVWSNEKGTHWIYGQGLDPAGGYAAEVYLRFNDGIVTVLDVK